MNDQEAIHMMQRCKAEILQLRRHIDVLEPKAAAYDNISAILGLLPQRGQSMGEGLCWTIDKRIQELEREGQTPAEDEPSL